MKDLGGRRRWRVQVDGKVENVLERLLAGVSEPGDRHRKWVCVKVKVGGVSIVEGGDGYCQRTGRGQEGD